MFRYMKAAPTTYVLHFRNGKLLKEGPGWRFSIMRRLRRL